LEDPVEYQLQGISQTQVATKKGMTFASALRHVLRQDPDVILVGEVRDEPTARMVIQSSMTGHLVLTTLHTNNATGAISRLVDLGIEPYLIASTLIGVLAQRLVRKTCPDCKGGTSATERCQTCASTGHSGRTGLYEWLQITPEIREQIQGNLDAGAIETLAVKQGMQTLWQQGRTMVAGGMTTEAELRRVLGAGSEE
jgi:type II secretory ATPase GspE/PulE/Tfp pilus assembly ATPase PilB-like protein